MAPKPDDWAALVVAVILAATLSLSLHIDSRLDAAGTARLGSTSISWDLASRVQIGPLALPDKPRVVEVDW